jgi:DNA-binding MarR family transcriptional regulator
MSEGAQVKNAADEEQVKKAEERELVNRDTELNDIIAVLSTPQGRRLVWRILSWTGCEGTPKRIDDALTYMAIGSGDVGRWLKSEVVEAGEDLLFQMMRENLEKRGDKNGRRRK